MHLENLGALDNLDELGMVESSTFGAWLELNNQIFGAEQTQTNKIWSLNWAQNDGEKGIEKWDNFQDGGVPPFWKNIISFLKKYIEN